MKTSPLFARPGFGPASAPGASCGVLGLEAPSSYKIDYIGTGESPTPSKDIAGSIGISRLKVLLPSVRPSRKHRRENAKGTNWAAHFRLSYRDWRLNDQANRVFGHSGLAPPPFRPWIGAPVASCVAVPSVQLPPV
jgi:hypothetical protein